MVPSCVRPRAGSTACVPDEEHGATSDDSCTDSSSSTKENASGTTDEDESATSDTDCAVAGQKNGVDIVELAQEWAALEDCDTVASHRSVQGHRTRYRNIAAAIEAAEEVVQVASRMKMRGSIKPEQLSKLHAFVGVVLFLAVNLRIFTCIRILLLPRWYKNLYSFTNRSLIVLLLLDFIFIVFQTVCARRDRGLALLRQRLWQSGSYFRLAAFNFYTIFVLGFLSGWQLLRSYRQIRNPSYRDSFLIELSDPGMLSGGALRMPRYSCHLSFIFEMPYVARITYAFALHGAELRQSGLNWFDLVLGIAWLLSLQLLVFSLLAFDHAISEYIQQRYAASMPCGFPFLHYIYRLCEVLAFFVAVGAGLILWSKELMLTSSCFVLYLSVSFAVLSWVSGGVSRRALFMTIPLFTANMGLYADRHGLLTPARRLTTALEGLRIMFVGLAALVYFRMNTRRTDLCALSMLAATMCCISLRVLGCVGPRKLKDFKHFDRTAPRDDRKKETNWQRGASADVFGRPLDEKYNSRELTALAPYLFAKGIGDQFASLVEICNEKDDIRLSRLKAKGKLGEGGFGRVYKVQDTHCGEMYALKLQRRDGQASYAVREAEALHESTHLYIVRLFRIFRTAEFYGILLELCDQDLNRGILEHLSPSMRAEGLPQVQVQHYLVCMMLALEHLHRKKVVFRDLKPENVLTVTAEDCPPVCRHAKLADFGCARSVDAEEVCDERPLGERPLGAPSITGAIGTPAFMCADAFMTETCSSVETAMKVVASRDWYALGCCLLLMVLGERGSRKVCVEERCVLLPPARERIRGTLEEALATGMSDPRAIQLALDLTVDACADRAGAQDIRRNSYAEGAVARAEEWVSNFSAEALERRRTRGMSRTSKLRSVSRTSSSTAASLREDPPP